MKGFSKSLIIAAAGMAAHLAGAIAAGTTLPVIGIPMKSGNLGGIDALLSTVQMPSGIPVATVAIDGATNAALLSVEILVIDTTMTVSTMMHGEYGIEDVCLSTLNLVGRNGYRKILGQIPEQQKTMLTI